MFKVLIYQFQKKYLPTFILASLQKEGLNHIIFLFLFFWTVLHIFFINIIRDIFFLIGKLFPKTVIYYYLLFLLFYNSNDV